MPVDFLIDLGEYRMLHHWMKLRTNTFDDDLFEFCERFTRYVELERGLAAYDFSI